VLLGVSGSVAAIKTVEVARLLAAWADVRVVTTEVGRRFIDGPCASCARAGQAC